MYKTVPRPEDRLAILSTPFGGPSEVYKIVDRFTLEYLINFPGRVWSISALDYRDETSRDSYNVIFTEMGYIPYSYYHVTDKNFRYLYSAKSTGVFGDVDLDNELIRNSKHGDFYHIQFENSNGPVTLIIWIATELDPRNKQWYLETYRKAAANQKFRLTVNELFFEFEGTVRLYVYEAPWSAQPSRELIRSKGLRGDRTLRAYLKPQVSIWLIFERDVSANPGITSPIYQPVKVKEVTGAGSQRWRSLPNDVYFLELQRPSHSFSFSNFVDTIEERNKVHLLIKLE